MSVTFHLSLHESDFVGTRLLCVGTMKPFTGPLTGTDITVEAVLHQEQCKDEDCQVYGPSRDSAMAHPDLEVSVNVSNTNAAHLLNTLGLDPFDLCGEEDAESFKGRVLLAAGLATADTGVPSVEVQLGGPLMIDAGRRPGYTDERLAQLMEVADAAIRMGRKVVWN